MARVSLMMADEEMGQPASGSSLRHDDKESVRGDAETSIGITEYDESTKRLKHGDDEGWAEGRQRPTVRRCSIVNGAVGTAASNSRAVTGGVFISNFLGLHLVLASYIGLQLNPPANDCPAMSSLVIRRWLTITKAHSRSIIVGGKDRPLFGLSYDGPLSPLPASTSSSSPAFRFSRQSLLRTQKPTTIPSRSTAAPSSQAQPPLPYDASTRLSNRAALLPKTSPRRLLSAYLSLSKPRLSFLVVLTTTAAYSLYPTPTLLSTSALDLSAASTLSPLTLLFLTTGTALSCASANTLNMLYEPSSDALMSRTRNRPLVRGLVSRGGALAFALATGVLGVGGLWFGVNPTVSFLGLSNIVLYAAVYTPLKRISVLNTWIGALVGGIPPLMGWAAATGHSAPLGGDSWRDLLFSDGSAGGWLLAGLLFCWQFPHFNSLSHLIAGEYRGAGLRMLAWTNPARNARVALRYSVLCIPLCIGLWDAGIVDVGFLATSTSLNGWMVWRAVGFWRAVKAESTAKVVGGAVANAKARGLFWASVWHLPVLLVLAMVQKEGLWRGLLEQWGEEESDEEREVRVRMEAEEDAELSAVVAA